MALDPLTAGLELARDVANKVWPDKSAEEQAALAAAVTLAQGQMEVNKAEATNPNLFVSGWRPFIGWVCGIGLAYHYLIYPMAVAYWAHILPLDAGDLIALVGTMMGMGGFRTYEKKIGVA